MSRRHGSIANVLVLQVAEPEEHLASKEEWEDDGASILGPLELALDPLGALGIRGHDCDES